MRMDILIVEDQRRIAEGLSVMLSSCKEDGIQIERTLIADNGESVENAGTATGRFAHHGYSHADHGWP